MKHLMSLGLILLMAVGAQAMAESCWDAKYKTRQKGTTLPDTILNRLNGMRIKATAPGGEEWNEDHCPGPDGALYKVGSLTDPTDPRAFRGEWTAASNNKQIVRYRYRKPSGGDLEYRWSLWRNSTGGLSWGDTSADPPTHEVIATMPTKPVSFGSGEDCSFPTSTP